MLIQPAKSLTKVLKYSQDKEAKNTPLLVLVLNI